MSTSIIYLIIAGILMIASFILYGIPSEKNIGKKISFCIQPIIILFVCLNLSSFSQGKAFADSTLLYVYPVIVSFFVVLLSWERWKRMK